MAAVVALLSLVATLTPARCLAASAKGLEMRIQCRKDGIDNIS